MFLTKSIENVFITVGKGGAYLFSKSFGKHIPIKKIKNSQLRDLLKTPNLNGISRNEIAYALRHRIDFINDCNECFV
ncbi:hypothetical protein LCGC14_2933200 [marine sediment metagenome]|uniref:Uncharacterized protein n=1 Tax=marine sediment metagenome TaxID=412755 RepID=A0A0F8Y7C1_9ZZZZ